MVEQEINTGCTQKKSLNFLWGFLLGTSFTFIIVIIFIIMITKVYFGISFGSLVESSRNLSTDLSGDTNIDNLDNDKVIDKLEQIQRIISRYYLFDEDITSVEDGIYAGFMQGLGDPYSVYYSKKEYEALNESTSGVYCGIGAVVNKNPNTGIVKIVRTFPGSPSEEAGLLADDIIYKIGDMEVTGLDLDVLVHTYIRGDEGTNVDITVIRGEKSEEKTLSVTRRSIEVPTVEAKLLDNNIGYVAVSQFDYITDEQFEEKIHDLQAQGADKLIVDLRDNPGGVLDTVVNMLDFILPDGKVLYTSDKKGRGDEYFSDDGKELGLPMVVIVNANSASASEIFAGAIKDFDAGTIVGIKTFGKGIVQNVIPLGDDTAIKITTQHYYTPSGYDLHEKGIEPHIEVELDKDAVYGEDSDNQLQEAIEILNK